MLQQPVFSKAAPFIIYFLNQLFCECVGARLGSLIQAFLNMFSLVICGLLDTDSQSPTSS